MASAGPSASMPKVSIRGGEIADRNARTVTAATDTQRYDRGTLITWTLL
jgi:hypothetical protein